MSIPHIESDYTPKDFLLKLLGKPLSPEPITENSLNPKTENSNSQSTIEDSTYAKVLSPKSNQRQRIHFQSMQNIQGLELREKNLAQQELRSGFDLKENIRKNSLTKEIPGTQSTKEIGFMAKHQPLNENQEVMDIVRVGNSGIGLESEQELIVRKTRMILNSILKNKLNDIEIGSILHSLQKGLLNTTQFDKLVSSSSIERNAAQSYPKCNQQQKQKTIIHSRSMDLTYRSSKDIDRRVKSCEKCQQGRMSRKQQKKRGQQTRQQILKSIKKIKQLVFLNEKSLKRTRRA